MRYNIQFIVITILFLMFSCKKELNSKTIEGKWNIITDSSYQGFAAASHFAGYTGMAGDYFNFDNGKLDIREKGELNTSDYDLISGSAIIITSFVASYGYKDTCTIIYNNKNDIIISSKFFYSPGGSSGRRVHLKR